MTALGQPDAGPQAPVAAAPGVLVIPLLTPTLPPATRTHCVVLGSGDDVIVVDPASPYEDEQAALIEVLAAHALRPRAIWLTHHHFDHVGGAEALREATGAPICAHPATAGRVRLRVDEPLYDGDEAAGFRALHTPGHARGHLAFWRQDDGLLVAGDLVAGQGTVVIDPPDGDLSDYLVTLGRLVQRGVGTLIPSHGPLIEAGEAWLLQTIAHRETRELQVEAALRDRGPCRPLDLVGRIYPEVASMFHPLAARQVLAHLLKLEQEGRVFRPDGGHGVPGAPVYMADGAIARPEQRFAAT